MPDRIIRESWAILRDDGTVAQGVLRVMDALSEHEAMAYLEHPGTRVVLEELNRCPLRVARVRLIEVGGEDEEKGQ